MPEIISDGEPFQTPLTAANDYYSKNTNPGYSSFIAATIGDAPAAFLTRGAERGAVEGASPFDRFLSGLTDPELAVTGYAPPAPIQSPQMAPEQYNERYAPRDADGKIVPIGDKPMPEALAQIIGKQKSDALEREGVLSRFANTHSWPTTFLAGSAASLLDPLNAGMMFMPGVGEGALAARLGGGLLARTGARLLAGGATGALMQAPVSGLKMALAPEEATDYGISDAMRDMLYGAAGMAALHTGLGTIGEALGRGRGPDAVRSPAVPDAATTNAAMRAALGEVAEGRPVDVAPVLDVAPVDAERASVSEAAPEAPAAPPTPEATPAPPAGAVEGFTTAKGSTYEVHEDGTTTRNKSFHPEHGPEDVGIKERSAKTIYVNSENDAMSLSGAGLSGLGPKGGRLVLRDGKATFVWENQQSGRWGTAPNNRDIPFTTEPAIGKYPVEGWNPASDVPGFSEAYSGQHAGNPIIEVRRATPAEPANLIGEPVASLPRHSVATAEGQSVDVAPVVVEARDLRTSADEGYNPALQPRDRNRAAAEQQVREMASRLEPDRLGFSAEADRGAPIVGPDGMVESGNGRVMAIREAYSAGNEAAARYRSWLTTQGVDADRYEQPVLVRQRLTPMTPEQRQGFAVAANRSTTLALSAPERALADARSITPDMLGLIRNPDDLAAISNRDFVRAFVQRLPQTEQGVFANTEGGLSAEGLGRIRNAILARAYGATPEGTAILARISEALHDDIKSISNALTAAAPDWAGLRADIEAGHVRGDVDLTPQLIEAVRRTADLRAKGTRLADALAQQDAFDRIEKPVEDWMRMFYDPTGRRAASAARIAEGLKVYAAEARKISAERGLDLGLPDIAAADVQRLAAGRANAAGGRPGETGLLFGGGPGNGPNAAADRGELQRSGPGGNRAGAGGTRTGGAEPGEGEPRPAELTFRDIARQQREGWAPGLSPDELATANEAVYGAHKAEPAAPKSGATPAAEGAPANPELAAAEEQLARVSPDKLLPEDRAELDRTAAAVNDAATLGEAMKTAASCLMGIL